MNWPKLKPEKGFGFRALMPKASETALDLIESLCSWDPSNRPSAAEALRNPLITKARNVLAPPPGFTRAGNVLANRIFSFLTEYSIINNRKD